MKICDELVKRQYGLSPATLTALSRRSLNTTVSLLQEKDPTPSDPVEAIPVEKRKHITEEIAKHNETKSKLAAEETSHVTTKVDSFSKITQSHKSQNSFNHKLTYYCNIETSFLIHIYLIFEY